MLLSVEPYHFAELNCIILIDHELFYDENLQVYYNFLNNSKYICSF